jgi:hypothetical protein
VLTFSTVSFTTPTPASRDLLSLHRRQLCETFYHSIFPRIPRDLRASEPAGEAVVAEPLCSPHAHSVPTLPVFIRLTRALILHISQPATSPCPPALRDLLPLHSDLLRATFHHSTPRRSLRSPRASEPVAEPVVAEPVPYAPQSTLNPLLL